MSKRTLWSVPAVVLGTLVATWTVATSCRSAAPVAVPQQKQPAPASTGPASPSSPPVTPSVPSREVVGVLPPALASTVIRVGVGVDVPRGSIGATRGVTVTPLGANAGGGRSVTVSRATFMPSGAVPGAGPGFRVQVAALADEPAAVAVADRLRQAVGLEPTVRWSDEARLFQVRVGSFSTRDEALRLAGRLVQKGFPGAFPVPEGGPSAETRRIRLVETGEDFDAVSVTPFDAADILALDATTYRGHIEVRAGQGASVTFVNVVDLESYLRGVVPNELSPQVYPEIEALKAQAVAARTYAIRNRGRFTARGYDICATPSCQVYKGQSSEAPLSDRAVSETSGIIVTYRGVAINAFYTSTCGGHTEDGDAVFEEQGAYLKGVTCLPERLGTERIVSQVEVRSPLLAGSLERDLALLRGLGVLSPEGREWDPGTAPREGEVRAWIDRLVAAARRTSCGVPGAPVTRRIDFMQALVSAFCWKERSERLLLAADVEALLASTDAPSFSSEAERRAAAVLVHEGVLSPFGDGSIRPAAPVTRGQALEMLARMAEVIKPPALIEGEVASVADGRIALRGESDARSLPVAPRVYLSRDLDGVRTPVRELHLTIGDPVRIVEGANGEAVFVESEVSRSGVAADRTSRYFRWVVRMTPTQVAEAVARYGTVGRVLDVVPRRLGVSGRVVELAVQGDAGEISLTGMKVRWGLGLRENLFVVDRERQPDGRVARFTFTGKGWGHGVGLCQVGAFGMAHAGSTFEEILRHYYSGVTLSRLP